MPTLSSVGTTPAAPPARGAHEDSTARATTTARRSRWLFVGSLLALLVVYVPLLGPSLLGQQVFAETGLVLRFEPWASVADPEDQQGVTIAHDTMDSALPRTHDFAERLRDGDFALWSPYVAGGSPLGSVPEQGLLSPLALPYLALPLSLAPAYVRLLEVLVAVGFTYLFLRRLSLTPGAALLGGLVYSCTAFLVLWNNWPQAQVAALIPALFWSTERALQLRRASAVVPIALSVASMVLASFPAVLVYSLYLLGPYVLVRTLASRPQVRTVLRSWTLAAAGLVLGVALVAFQLLPFVEHLGELDLSHREQAPSAHAPFSSLVTLAVPYAFGTETDGTWFGYKNTIETIAFVGVVCLVLALLAVCLRVRLPTPRGVVLLFAGAVVSLVLVAWSSETALQAAQQLPFLGSSFIGRTRAVLGFAFAVLAAIGAEKLVRLRAGGRPVAAWAVLPVAVCLLAFAWAARGALAAAADRDRTDVLLGNSVLPLVVLCCVAVAAASALRQHRTGLVALVLLPALVAVEGLAFVAPRWPSEDPDQFYPRTGVHDFLAANLGSDRYAAAAGVMFPSTTSYYGLRAVSGHAFHQTTWKEAVQRIDPDVTQAPTLTFVGSSVDSAASPVLDRLAARYFVASIAGPVFGTTPPQPVVTGQTELSPGDTLTVPLTAAPRRALVLPLASPVTGGATGRLLVTLRDREGRVVGTVERPGLAAGQVGPLQVPLAGESGPLLRAVEATLQVDGVTLALGTGPDGAVAVGEVLPADDGLAVAHAGESVVYERLRALPRVRFASSAVRVEDGQDALDVLASGTLTDAQVVLSPSAGQPAPAAQEASTTARPTTVEIVEDSGDVLRLRVAGGRPGWVVVADALQQDGWVAELDGRPVDLLDADHAAVAVTVPEGQHAITLRYEPPGMRAGTVVSLLAAAAALGLLVAGRGRAGRGLRGSRAEVRRASVL